MMNTRKLILILPMLAVLLASLSASAAESVLQLRLRAPDIASDEAWAATCKMIADNPGCCDEVWFSTGVGLPPLAVHADRAERLVRAAADLRALGIVPSLQFQATIGHGDNLSLKENCSAKSWTGWTGSTGTEAVACNCPRQRGFLDYVRAVARLYAAFKPKFVWVDDDLRITNHRPATIGSLPGCWCDRCLADFNAQTGAAWTRSTLAAAVKKRPALEQRWISFSIQSIADVARAIAEEFRAVSPTSQMALQHGTSSPETIRRILETLHGTSGAPVGFRPGGGAYYDVNPNNQILKSLTSARFRRTFGNPPWISVWTPEIESWPRVYGSRSAQSILVEGFSALMYGMTAVSFLVTQTGNEDLSLYSRTILKPLAAAAPVLKGYAAANTGTHPVGFSSDLPVGRLYAYAATGVPVLFGIGRPCGTLTDADVAINRCTAPTSKVQAARAAVDARAGGAPALVRSPFVGLMLPRVAVDGGALRTVALLNVRIDAQGPVDLLLRGVPSDVTTARWCELRRAPVDVPLRRAGADVVAVIPEIGAWNAGYLDLTAGRRAVPASPSAGK